MEENEVNKKKSKRKIWVIVIMVIIIVMLATVGYILPTYVFPSSYISTIETSYENKEYKEVAKYFSKLSNIKTYLKNDQEKYHKLEQKVELAYGLEQFENKKYKVALETLEKIENKTEEVNKKVNDAHYEIGKECVQNKQYEEAVKHLEVVKDKQDMDTLIDEACYHTAVKYLEEKNYAQATYYINKVKNEKYENLKSTKQKIHYEFGKQYFESDDLEKALEHFKLSKGYEDTNSYLSKCAMVEAEKAIQDGEANRAKKLYESIPDNAEYNGIRAADRKKQLKKYQALLNASGEWKSTKEYIESRHVWRYDGSWDNWYNNEPTPTSIISLKTYLNKDGSVTLKGTAKFYAYNNYSSLSQYCNSYLTTRNIEFKNITSIPASKNLGNNTKLTYSNGKFTIKYSKKDEYSANFYNVYNSTVTYGKKTKSY